MEAAAAGFPPSSAVPALFRELIADDVVFDEARRLQLLTWATALVALPGGGLQEPIKIRLFPDADEHTLPEAHTCTHELHIPDYSSREVLQQKLLMALDHRDDGFLVE